MPRLPHIESLDPQMVAILREKTSIEKVAMIAAAHRTARMLANAGVRHLHPDWSDEKVQAEVLKRVTGGTR